MTKQENLTMLRKIIITLMTVPTEYRTQNWTAYQSEVCYNLSNLIDELGDIDDEQKFTPCSSCDGHPACEDFGCAIKADIPITNSNFLP
jgi:hypothetical protein